MLFSWLKRRRRRKLLATPFPNEWRSVLSRHCRHYARLSPAEQAKLRDDLRVFIAEKHWEGCDGLVLTAEIKVAVAAWACLLALGMDDDAYEHVRTILVYPAGFRADVKDSIADGLALEGEEDRAGEAWHRGPVILSWADALEDGQYDDGQNLILHEFAHQLDTRDGASVGVPPLADRRLAEKWREVFESEYQRLVRAADRGKPTLLDHYGAENKAEFFAVATECFFEQPKELRQRHPQLYELLRSYYRQDPAQRD